MSKPNILVIQADQMTSECLSAYGKPYAITPNIDHLAKEGTTFLNNYCNNPVCGPSRASMMTGRIPSDIGVFDNGTEFLPSEPTFAHYLRVLGYKTTLCGKMHFVGPDQLHGFEQRLTTDIYPSDFGWTADWSQTDEPYSPSVMSLHSIVEAGVCERNLQIDHDEQVYNMAKQELFDHARFEKDRPFLMHVSFTQPHNPFVAARKYWDMYEHRDIPNPEVDFIPYERRDPWSQRYYLTIRQDEFDITEQQLSAARRAYFAMVTHIDEFVGGLIETLKSINEYDNTYIFFISDHGEMLGERGMWYKFNPFEASVRVPMIAKGLKFKANHKELALTSLVDLLPTLTNIASDETFKDYVAPYDGRSLFHLPTRYAQDDCVFIEYNGEGLYRPAFILIKGDKKLIYCATDPLMFYDLTQDPYELENLANVSKYKDDIENMLNIIHSRWREEDVYQRVIKSQQKRLFVQKAMKHGHYPSWDYTPPFDASTSYVRSAIDPNTTATKQRRRYPYIAMTPVQFPRNRD